MKQKRSRFPIFQQRESVFFSEEWILLSSLPFSTLGLMPSSPAFLSAKGGAEPRDGNAGNAGVPYEHFSGLQDPGRKTSTKGDKH